MPGRCKAIEEREREKRENLRKKWLNLEVTAISINTVRVTEEKEYVFSLK